MEQREGTLEGVVNLTIYKTMNTFWKNKRVFITGHTGFKGSWLVFWLKKMGAEVYGYSLNIPTVPNHYNLLKLDINSTIGDICDLNKLIKTMNSAKPEIVFHLAAQSLVRLSYEKPVDTFATNVMGTINIFEASRKISSVRAVINITSDKCYENRECGRSYHENDRMGGHDPYSTSKGCSELLTSCYRRSYFSDLYEKKHNILLASCRAGNVIGGGDWAKDRLIPDIMKAAAEGRKSVIRNPHSVRPWQHVLEPLAGYLLLGQKLLEGKKEFAESWNFGPNNRKSMAVEEVVRLLSNCWEKIKYASAENTDTLHEAKLLKLDSSKANKKLNWMPMWDSKKALSATTGWYRNYYENGIINTESDIKEYENEELKR